jgi:hypothetical protein
VTDKYKADLSVDKSTDRSVWIRMGKLRIDRPCLTIWKSNQNRLGSADGKNPKIVCVSPIHRLCVVNVGQNKRIVSAVADTRKVTIVSANQSMVEVSIDSCYTGIS